MKDKLKQAFNWAKDKWVFLAGFLVALTAVLVVRPNKRMPQVARENAQIDAKIYKLDKAASKKLDEEVEKIDRDTAEKVTKLRNSKKKDSKKFQKQKEDRVKDLSGKTAKELADLLKNKKD